MPAKSTGRAGGHDGGLMSGVRLIRNSARVKPGGNPGEVVAVMVEIAADRPPFTLAGLHRRMSPHGLLLAARRPRRPSPRGLTRAQQLVRQP